VNLLTQWEHIYPNLVVLLVHAWLVVDALVAQFAPEFQEDEVAFPRRLAGLPLYHGAEPSEGGHQEAVGQPLREWFEAAGCRCPSCDTPLVSPSRKEELGLFYLAGAVRCSQCGAEAELTCDASEREVEEPADDELVQDAFRRWASEVGLAEADRTPAVFAVFVAGWSANREAAR
jgi:hypothetical protein